MGILSIVQRADDGLAALERVLVIALTAAIACIMMAQVVLRYFFSSPIFWAEEISVQLLVFTSLFGLSLLTRANELVSIDFLPRALPERQRHALFAALGLVMFAILVFVAWLSWNWIAQPDVRIELSATTQLPRWYNYSALPLAMAAMSFHQLVGVLRHIRNLIKHEGAGT